MLPGLYLKKETKSVITVTGTGHWRGPSGNSFTRSFIPQGLAAAAPAAAAPEVPSPADSGPFREPEGRGVTEPWGEGPPASACSPPPPALWGGREGIEGPERCQQRAHRGRGAGPGSAGPRRLTWGRGRPG